MLETERDMAGEEFRIAEIAGPIKDKTFKNRVDCNTSRGLENSLILITISKRSCKVM